MKSDEWKREGNNKQNKWVVILLKVISRDKTMEELTCDQHIKQLRQTNLEEEA